MASADRLARILAQDAHAWNQLGLAWQLRPRMPEPSAGRQQRAHDPARPFARATTPAATRTPPVSRAPAAEGTPGRAVEVHAPEPIDPTHDRRQAIDTQAGSSGSPTVATPPSGGGASSSRRRRAEQQLAQILADYTAAAPHEATGTPHTTIVFGEGDPCARIMFVGEAPGADEDRLGRPFVGRAGQKLDQMIQAMGLAREQVYIANVLKVRPPNNATPTVEEALACAPFLYRQIEAVGPEAIVALGLPAARLLTGQMLSMRELRGRWWTLRTPSGASFQVLPTYHPAYLLRNYTPETRRKVWEDLKMVLERLGLPVPARR